MKTKIAIFLVLYTIIQCTRQDNHTITKRSLLFPRTTVLQFTYGLSVPLVLPSRSIIFSLAIQANYDLPYNESLLHTKIIQAKSNQDSFDISRESLYRYFIGFLDSFHLNGEECFLRVICDIAETPMHRNHKESLLEDIVHFIFTPTLDWNGGNSSTLQDKSVRAEKLGQQHLNCIEQYPDCIFSLVNLFTGKYIIT